MATKSPNSTSSALDIQSILSASVNNTKRLQDIAKRTSAISKERGPLQKQLDALTAEEAKLMSEVASLTGAVAPVTKASKPAPKAKNGRKVVKASKGKNGSRPKNGVALHDVLLNVLPGSDKDPITKDEIASLVAATGYKSSASDPKVVIGQTLGKSTSFSNASHGKWRLTKVGERAKERLANAESDESTPTSDTSTAPAADSTAAAPTAAAPVASADGPTAV